MFRSSYKAPTRATDSVRLPTSPQDGNKVVQRFATGGHSCLSFVWHVPSTSIYTQAAKEGLQVYPSFLSRTGVVRKMSGVQCKP
jgi:hypothetical protein